MKISADMDCLIPVFQKHKNHCRSDYPGYQRRNCRSFHANSHTVDQGSVAYDINGIHKE